MLNVKKMNFANMFLFAALTVIAVMEVKCQLETTWQSLYTNTSDIQRLANKAITQMDETSGNVRIMKSIFSAEKEVGSEQRRLKLKLCQMSESGIVYCEICIVILNDASWEGRLDINYIHCEELIPQPSQFNWKTADSNSKEFKRMASWAVETMKKMPQVLNEESFLREVIDAKIQDGPQKNYKLTMEICEILPATNNDCKICNVTVYGKPNTPEYSLELSGCDNSTLPMIRPFWSGEEGTREIE